MRVKKTKQYLVIILIIGLVLSIGYLTFKFRAKGEKEISINNIEEKIIKIEELSTVKYTYTDVLSYKNSRNLKGLNIPMTQKSFIIQYKGYLKAGVDLEKLDIKIKDKDSIQLNLEKPKILDNVIIDEDIGFFDERDGLFNKLKFNDLYDILVKEKKNSENKAINNGILEEAEENTRELLTYILEEMDFKNIIIEFN